jgi:hypothetical protein
MADRRPDGAPVIGTQAAGDQPAGAEMHAVSFDVGGQPSPAAQSESGYGRRISWRWLVAHRRPFL